MCRTLLNQLTSDSFVLSAGIIATPEALRHFLLRSKEVHEVRNALRQGAITEETIRELVSSLMKDFRVGTRFEHELALAALAVVLERWATDFAEEFLLDLAKLKLAEMPLGIRVARECLKYMAMMAHNTSRDFQPWTWPSRLCSLQVQPDWLGSQKSIQTNDKLIDMRPTNAAA